MAVFDGGEIVEKLLAEECDTKLLDGLLARWPAIDRAIIASTGGRTAPLARMLRVRAVKSSGIYTGDARADPQRLRYARKRSAPTASPPRWGRRSWPKGATRWSSISERPSPSTTCRADGIYRGGAISPGMGMRFQALHRYTARLPLCRETAEERLYGTITTSASSRA